MPWVVSGSCTHCGVCCKPPVVLDNPCIVRGEDRCRYYTDTADTGTRFGHCLILQKGGNYNSVRDRFDNKMTREHIRWFEENCLTFPTAEKDALDLADGRFTLPTECTFSLTWVP